MPREIRSFTLFSRQFFSWHCLETRFHLLFSCFLGPCRSYSFRDLKPDTVYEIVVKSRNVNGFGEFSDPIQFRTLCASSEIKEDASRMFISTTLYNSGTDQVLPTLWVGYGTAVALAREFPIGSTR